MNRILTALVGLSICAPALAQTPRAPVFDGVTITGTQPSAFPTPTAGDSTTKPATTAFVAGAVGVVGAAAAANATAIGAETTRATGVEATKAATTALSSEAATARAAEQAAQATANAAATPSAVAAAVATEATRATGVEATKAAAAALTTETSRATTAEGVNATAISSEATTARAAEQAAQATATAAATPSAVATAVATETTRATGIESLKAPLLSPTLTTPTLNGKIIVNGTILRLPAVNSRVPTASDGLTANYAVGAYWNSPNGPYVSARSTSGAAAWLANDTAATTLPLDNVPGAIGAYGTRKLRAAYAGSAIQVTRASDSTALAIGFIGNALDTATEDAFCAGTSCAITIWYDQSGSGNNATAAASTAPHIAAFNKIGNARSILFDSAWTGAGNAPASFMTLPAGVAATFNASSAIVLARTRDIQHVTHIFQWTNSGSNSLILGRVPSTVFQTGMYIPAFGQFPTGSFMSATPYVAGYTSSGTQFESWQDDVINGGGATGNTSPLAGGFIGQAPAMDSYSGYQEMAAIIFYPIGMNDTQRVNLTSSLHWNFQTTPQARANWVSDGDSITDGYQSSFMQNWLRLAEPDLQKPMRITNIALFGDTLAGRVGAYASNVAPLFSATASDNILTIFAGTNDLGAGSAASGVEASVQSYTSLAHATGYKVIVATILPVFGRTAGQETARQTYNTWLVANWASFADGMADVNADPTMGGASTVAANTALYADGLHPTTLGYSYIAPIFAAAVNSLLAP